METSLVRSDASYGRSYPSILLWLRHPDCKQSGPPRLVGPVLLFVALALCGFASAAELRFRDHARVARSVVTLGDVAEIRAENTREVASLAAVSLFPAPVGGSNAYVEEILETLELRGVAVRDLVISGSRVVAIRPVSASQPVMKPPVAGSSGVTPVSGFTAYEAAVAERDAFLKKVAGTPRPQATNVNDAAPEPVVRRGEAVKAIVVAGSVVVTTRGVAESDGAIGQLVTIRSPDRKRTFEGVVVGPQTVRVGGGSQ